MGWNHQPVYIYIYIHLLFMQWYTADLHLSLLVIGIWGPKYAIPLARSVTHLSSNIQSHMAKARKLWLVTHSWMWIFRSQSLSCCFGLPSGCLTVRFGKAAIWFDESMMIYLLSKWRKNPVGKLWSRHPEIPWKFVQSRPAPSQLGPQVVKNLKKVRWPRVKWLSSLPPSRWCFGGSQIAKFLSGFWYTYNSNNSWVVMIYMCIYIYIHIIFV